MTASPPRLPLKLKKFGFQARRDYLQNFTIANHFEGNRIPYIIKYV